MKNEDNIEISNIVRTLSSIFVNIENSLKSTPDISLQDFCEQQMHHPNKLLYSKGFSGLITMASLVPIKQALESSGNDKFKYTHLRTARNALCHGSIEYLENGKIKFIDKIAKKEIELAPTEIIDLASDAYSEYRVSQKTAI